MNNMLTEFRIQSRFFKFLKSSEWATWFLDAYSVKLMFPINPLKEYRKLKLKLFCFNGIMLALYTLAVFGAIELFVPLKSPFLIPIVWVWSWTAMTLFQAFIMDTILNGWLTSEWKTCQFRSELCQVLRMVAVNEKSGGLVTESLLLLSGNGLEIEKSRVPAHVIAGCEESLVSDAGHIIGHIKDVQPANDMFKKQLKEKLEMLKRFRIVDPATDIRKYYELAEARLKRVEIT